MQVGWHCLTMAIGVDFRLGKSIFYFLFFGGAMGWIAHINLNPSKTKRTPPPSIRKSDLQFFSFEAGNRLWGIHHVLYFYRCLTRLCHLNDVTRHFISSLLDPVFKDPTAPSILFGCIAAGLPPCVFYHHRLSLHLFTVAQ